jgi:hypothetical protein
MQRVSWSSSDVGVDNAHLNQSNHVSPGGNSYSNYYGQFMERGRGDGGHVVRYDGSAEWVNLASWSESEVLVDEGVDYPMISGLVIDTDSKWYDIGHWWDGGRVGSSGDARLMVPGSFTFNNFHQNWDLWVGDWRGIWDYEMTELLPGYFRATVHFDRPISGHYSDFVWNE